MLLKFVKKNFSFKKFILTSPHQAIRLSFAVQSHIHSPIITAHCHTKRIQINFFLAALRLIIQRAIYYKCLYARPSVILFVSICLFVNRSNFPSVWEKKGSMIEIDMFKMQIICHKVKSIKPIQECVLLCIISFYSISFALYLYKPFFYIYLKSWFVYTVKCKAFDSHVSFLKYLSIKPTFNRNNLKGIQANIFLRSQYDVKLNIRVENVQK